MYKKSSPKDKQDDSNKDISIEGEAPLVPIVLPEQQDQFSLVATSSVPLPAQALIFSMEPNIEDPINSIINPHINVAKFLKHVGFGEQDEAENMCSGLIS